MIIQKELSDISLHITEPEYRQRPELSYSTLSTYETLGFTGLDHLFDKKESPSLTLGSVVDSMLTGGMDEFENLYTVLDLNITDSGAAICKTLAGQHLPFGSFHTCNDKNKRYSCSAVCMPVSCMEFFHHDALCEQGRQYEAYRTSFRSTTGGTLITYGRKYSKSKRR